MGSGGPRRGAERPAGSAQWEAPHLSLVDRFGAEAAEPQAFVVQDWSMERWTSGAAGAGDASPGTRTTVDTRLPPLQSTGWPRDVA